MPESAPVRILTEACLLSGRLEEEGFAHAVIGGAIVGLWGEPRGTSDLDLSVLTGFTDEEEKVRKLLEIVKPRFVDSFEKAMRHRVVLGVTEGGISVDIGMAAFPQEEAIIGRSVRVQIVPGGWARVLTPEDLIIMKAFAGRAIDWKDVRSVISRQGAKLDWELIERELASLLHLLDDHSHLDQLLRLREETMRDLWSDA